MKINILVRFIDGPWGGGNQFLKALRDQLVKRGVYVENPYDADVILFNSYPSNDEEFFDKVHDLVLSGKTVVHRVDGPISIVRGRDQIIDKMIAYFNSSYAQGTVFQSVWSRDNCKQMGIGNTLHEIIINNASDSKLFYPSVNRSTSDKLRIVATSWSSNPKKGFEVYKFLDENLNFDRFEMTFIGNTELCFKNIVHVMPLESKDLADKLREHDIYITASIDDPCSNSLIEAMQCGLPVVVRNSGGHPELMKDAGLIFVDTKDVISVIERVANSLENYRQRLPKISIEKIANEYFSFCEKVFKDKTPQKIKFNSRFVLKSLSLLWKIKVKARRGLIKIKSKFGEHERTY